MVFLYKTSFQTEPVVAQKSPTKCDDESQTKEVKLHTQARIVSNVQLATWTEPRM